MARVWRAMFCASWIACALARTDPFPTDVDEAGGLTGTAPRHSRPSAPVAATPKVWSARAPRGTDTAGHLGPAARKARSEAAVRDKRAAPLADPPGDGRTLELRRGGGGAPAAGPRVSETQLSSSSFALTGDSAHNQAMVYWTGHNNSVILILTKLYDFNLGTVTESSLWRSVDLGSTYQKLNDKVGYRTVLSYLYVCPSNKKKFLILTDPDVESSVVVSSDEGSSFQKFSVSFIIQSLLFHPTQEDWLLGYSHDHKLYNSRDFGKNWNLVHEAVSPSRFYWSVAGLDRESDLVHLEAHTESGLVRYITCLAQRCADTRQYPFPGRVDEGSLVVQDEYVFVQVTTSGRAKYYVSYQREAFTRIQLPKYCLPKDMHIISTDESQVMAAVQEWSENDTYSLYISDHKGLYFSPALPHLRTGRGAAGNLVVDIYKVAGFSGILLANRKEGRQVKTYISFSKGQRWSLLKAPAVDLAGNSLNCRPPSCSLHLHLQMSENPYTPDSISSKESVPGIIVATGNIGSELSYQNVGMFISSDAGNTWRQVRIFEEEHRVWFLEEGGALVAIIQATVPISHLWISLDEGRHWQQHVFSPSPLFVDGILMDQDLQHHVIMLFGHFSYRSEWQLIKVDYRGLFSRQCSEGDYQPWYLLNQGEPCVMGQRQVYKRRRAGSRCILGKGRSRRISADPCACNVFDFECDYGFERQMDGKCLAAFWYHGNSAGKGCSIGQSFLNSTGYRKVVSNSCKESGKEPVSPRMQQCDLKAPRGVRLSTAHEELSAPVGTNVTFLLHLDRGGSLQTDVRLDFGDGIAVTYSNLSHVTEGIRHIYKTAGIFSVTARVENSLGTDSSVLFLHITSPLEQVYLSAPAVAVRGKQSEVSAVVWPSQTKMAIFYWWIENNTEPIITLEGKLSHTFQIEGTSQISVQVSSGGVILQDSKAVRVSEFFRSLLLSFSPNLEEHKPAIPDWRQDVARVVMTTLSQVSGFPSEQLLVCVLAGTPTAAEVFILPAAQTHTQSGELGNNEQELEKVLGNMLNQNLVQFQLKPDVTITAYLTQLTLAPLIDSSPLPRASAMLLLLSLAFLGVAIFFIYKFKRKIPWIQVHTEDSHEKEPDVMNAVSQSDGSSKIPRDFSSPRITLSQFPSRVPGRMLATVQANESKGWVEAYLLGR
uniref:PKD domain-containing protein n=1 Tax=Denticeps clupeoides TaxID=299321 RepID=A0AAY4DML3_9TELE